MKLLSIIIPTYNMQAYLDRCLTSLVCDGVGDELEVLVVIDGATDNSSAIAHGYAERHPHIFRVIDKENGNYGSCVNRGLKEATGKYVRVLDADDYFRTDAFDRYFNDLRAVDADFVLSDYSFVYEGAERPQHFHLGLKPNQVQQVADISLPEFPMHALAYRRQLLLDIQYRQTEGVSHTDMEWIFIPLFHVHTVAYLPCDVYQYLLGRAGQTVDPRLRSRAMRHSITVAGSMLRTYEATSLAQLPKSLLRLQHHRLFMYVSSTYKDILIYASPDVFDAQQANDFDALVRRCAPDIYDELPRRKPYNRFGFYPLNHIRLWRTRQQRFTPRQIRISDALAFLPRLLGK